MEDAAGDIQRAAFVSTGDRPGYITTKPYGDYIIHLRALGPGRATDEDKRRTTVSFHRSTSGETENVSRIDHW